MTARICWGEEWELEMVAVKSSRMSHGGQHHQLGFSISIEVEVRNEMPHVRTSPCNVVAEALVIE